MNLEVGEKKEGLEEVQKIGVLVGYNWYVPYPFLELDLGAFVDPCDPCLCNTHDHHHHHHHHHGNDHHHHQLDQQHMQKE